ncbi:hypothetical protein VTL71DRAFT_9938 [Oculimacula yallundae]|uniref:Calpastatin n=1 Tax=Oculimacula yallundae TaxID=86028 RepID=A0ABR4BQZ6_9HELO
MQHQFSNRQTGNTSSNSSRAKRFHIQQPLIDLTCQTYQRSSGGTRGRQSGLELTFSMTMKCMDAFRLLQRTTRVKYHTRSPDMGFIDEFNLARFVAAQRTQYPKALAEMQNGKKTTHWIWYIFPQLTGLSTSANGKTYGITSLAEAQAYLKYPILRDRLVEITQVVLDSRTRNIGTLMGSDIDVKKMHASMTLFLRADPEKEVFDFQAVLDKYYKGATQADTDSKLGL